MNYFDEVAEQILKAHEKKIHNVKIRLQLIVAKAENDDDWEECSETLNRPFIDYNPVAEAQACMYNEVL